MKIQRLLLIGTAWAVCGVGVGGWGQQRRPAPIETIPLPTVPGDRTGIGNPPFGRDDPNVITISPGMEAQQTRSRNSERQKRLQGDADKLLALAAALKEAVDKPATSATSVEAGKKAEEIERLAKSVREHMKG